MNDNFQVKKALESVTLFPLPALFISKLLLTPYLKIAFIILMQ
jgi:hypothetical protein